MASKFFSISVLVFIVQGVIVHGDGNSDPRLASCTQKLIEQLDKVDFKRPPACFDRTKLEDAKQHATVLHNFGKGIPDSCKKPSRKNIEDCLKQIADNLNAHSKEMRAEIIASITSLVDGTRGCLSGIQKAFNNLDEYVLNGCKDD